MLSVNEINRQVLLCRVNILLIVTRDEHLYLDLLAVLVQLSLLKLMRVFGLMEDISTKLNISWTRTGL